MAYVIVTVGTLVIACCLRVLTRHTVMCRMEDVAIKTKIVSRVFVITRIFPTTCAHEEKECAVQVVELICRCGGRDIIWMWV